MRNTAIQLKAIAIVIAYRVVMSDMQYIDAMQRALNLKESEDGEPDIFKLLFRGDTEKLASKLAAKELTEQVLSTPGIPLFVKVQWLKEFMDPINHGTVCLSFTPSMAAWKAVVDELHHLVE